MAQQPQRPQLHIYPSQDDGHQQQQQPLVFPMNVNVNGAVGHSPITPLSSTPITSPVSPYQNPLSYYHHHQQQPSSRSLHSYPSPISAPPNVSTWRDVEPGHGPVYVHQSPTSTMTSPIDQHSSGRYPATFVNPPPPPPMVPLPSQSYDSPSSHSEDMNTPEPTNIPYLIHENECTTFISKLYHLLSRPEYNRFLRWNEAGDTFILTNTAEFARLVLPRFFRHSNASSFVRQLNLYGFQRVSAIHILEMADPHGAYTTYDHTGQARSETIQASGFTHPNFRRGQRHLLGLLKPRNTRKKKPTAAQLQVQSQIQPPIQSHSPSDEATE